MSNLIRRRYTLFYSYIHVTAILSGLVKGRPFLQKLALLNIFEEISFKNSLLLSFTVRPSGRKFVLRACEFLPARLGTCTSEKLFFICKTRIPTSFHIFFSHSFCGPFLSFFSFHRSNFSQYKHSSIPFFLFSVYFLLLVYFVLINSFYTLFVILKTCFKLSINAVTPIMYFLTSVLHEIQ